MYFIELQRFGWNWLTASFLIVAIITTWQYRALALQARRIWTHRSAEAVSITMATAVFFVFAASLVYGFMMKSLVITYSGCLSLVALFIMKGAWKFGAPTARDRLVFWVGLIGVLILPMTPVPVFLGFALAGTIPMADQVRELLRVGTRGVLHGEWLLTLVVKNAWLVVFAFSFGDLIYKVCAPIYLGLAVCQLALWWHYRTALDGKKLV